MKVSEDVKLLLDRVSEGELEQFATDIEGSDFGFFVPTFVENGVVKLMEDGKRQVETNLKITIADNSEDIPDNAEVVAWMGGSAGKDSSCSHGGTDSCSHCTGHTGACRHCTGHTNRFGAETELVAPELDYSATMQELEIRKNLLEPLASKGFGLSLLHGHNSQCKFTKLPVGTVSVIANGVTSFRSEDEVAADPSFVPSAWRFVDGALRVAAGFSES